MALTQKQENFCLAYVKTGNASEAYRQSYSCENQKEATINNNAYKLLKNTDILTRTEELNRLAVKSTILTIEQRKEILSKIAENVTFDKDGNAGFTDARGAIDLLNKMDGVYIEKRETELRGKLDTEFRVKFVKPDA